jgi:ribosomal protein L20A (L18A)
MGKIFVKPKYLTNTDE